MCFIIGILDTDYSHAASAVVRKFLSYPSIKQKLKYVKDMKCKSKLVHKAIINKKSYNLTTLF